MTSTSKRHRVSLLPGRRATCVVQSAILVFLASAAVAIAQTATPVALKGTEATAALERGDVDQAVLLYNAALDDTSISNDRRAVLLTERGAALMKRRNFKAALDDFNKAASIYPEYPAIYVNRGNLLLMMSQGPDTIKEAIKDFDRSIVLSPALAAAFGNRGAAKLKLGAPVPAIVDFTHAISLQPQNPASLNGRGLARLALGQTTAAIRDFSRAVFVNPAFAQGYRNRADADIRLGRAADAVEDLSRALAFDPRRVDDYIARGEAYLATGNAAAALTDFTKALELNPKSVEGHIGLGDAKANLNATDEALAELSRAIELEPRSSRAYAVRAWIYGRSQQLDLGDKDVERALRLEPVTADAYWAQGELKEAAGDRDGATGAYARALGLNIRHRETLAALVRLGLEPQREAVEIGSAGLDGWRVTATGSTQFVATHPQFPALSVTLEMMGEGTPRITGWERQKAPYASYGLLHFAAGSLPLAQATTIVESTAVIDLSTMSVIGMPVEKMSERVAKYAWGESQLVVTGADGLAETISLGTRRERRESADGSAVPKRNEAAGTFAGRTANDGPPAARREYPVREASRPRKSKSLFDLLFGN